MAKKKVIIIGGGMAGLTCGIQCARAGAKVTLIEKNAKLGKKLLVTGNGRCNLTNTDMTSGHFHSESCNIFESVYRQCDKNSTINFLESIGISLVEGDGGKLYPKSLQAASVVKALLYECQHLGVDIIYDAPVKAVEFKNKFIVHTKDKSYYGSELVIATGGKSYSDSGSTGDGYRFAEAFGHSIVPTYKSIVQLKSEDGIIKPLKGLKVQVVGKILSNGHVLRQDEGELLFTEYGLSGPVILQLSTMVNNRIDLNEDISVEIDMIPEMAFEELDDMLMHRFHQFSYRSVEECLNGYLNSRMIIPICKKSHIKHMKKAGDVTKEERNLLCENLKSLKIRITDTYLWNQAQVTKGGVDCREIDSQSLESLKQTGLYFAGEVMDIDGDCGGYNLQWAISSGYTVASHINN